MLQSVPQILLAVCSLSALSFWLGVQIRTATSQPVGTLNATVADWRPLFGLASDAGRRNTLINAEAVPLRPLRVDTPGQESAQWAPTVLSECQPWMRDTAAPCYRQRLAADSNLLVAQELIYPDFMLREPSFINDEQRRVWLPRLAHGHVAGDRARHNADGWVHYLGQRGQVLVFSDVVLRPTLSAGGWVDDACMEHGSDHSSFMYPRHLRDEPAATAPAAAGAGAPAELHSTANSTVAVSVPATHSGGDVMSAQAQQQGNASGTAAAEAGPLAEIRAADDRTLRFGTSRPGAAAAMGFNESSGDADSVVLATTPDAGHWQHWLDRTSHVLMQAAEHINNQTVAVTAFQMPAQPPWQPTLWAAVGIADPADGVWPTTRLPQTGMLVRRLVYACRAPLIHPYFALRLTGQAIRQARGPAAQRAVPLQQKKVVMYASRKPGAAGKMVNGGRNVQNEDELFPAIEALLAERGRGERLELFNSSSFADFPALVRYFNEEVLAFIGPHGGALLNHLWMGPDTLILEIMPDSMPDLVVFWEQATMLGQSYWPLTSPSIPETVNDVYVTVGTVLDILRRQLGVPLADPPVQHSYPWKIPTARRRRQRHRRSLSAQV